MKKILAITLLLLTSASIHSQIHFESGYIIRKNNEKVSCLIKNLDWRNNPKEIEYKLGDNPEIKKENTTTVKEFGLTDHKVKFISATVKLDRSSEKLNSLGRDRAPQFSTENLFLRVLLEGDANLYLFEDENAYKFFYTHNNSEVEPLIFKSFLNTNLEIDTNDQYKQQLWMDLKCEGISMKDVNVLKYEKNSLISFFEKYNKCKNPAAAEATSFKEEIVRPNPFHMSIRLGLSNSILKTESIATQYGYPNIDFGSKISIRIGAEFEYVLPLYRNKWSIIAEPSYQSYKSDATTADGNHTVDYKSFDIPVGVRYYLFLNDDSKMFFNGVFSYNIDLGSKLNYTIFRRPLEADVKPDYNFAIGVGYKFKDRYSFELRYALNRDLTNEDRVWENKFNSTSFILGYKLF